jgi:hypothetical protein
MKYPTLGYPIVRPVIRLLLWVHHPPILTTRWDHAE